MSAGITPPRSTESQWHRSAAAAPIAFGALTVTAVVAVTEPAALVAVKTYVVVVSGLTFTVPVAEVDARFPGAMFSVVAPDVVQLSALMPPRVMLVGFAVNELIVGRLGAASRNAATWEAQMVRG